jgi:hypothetical protein
MLMPARKRGKPAHEPTKLTTELVTLHATMGTPQSLIADLLDIDDKTLRKYYRKELDQSLAKANATIGGSLFNNAKNGNTAAQIFWMKTRAGWREKDREEEKDITPKPLEVTFNVLPAVAEITVTTGAGDGKSK